MIDERFVFIALLLNIAGSVSYILDVIRGKARPNRISWMLWALAPLIGFVAQLKEGVGLQSVLTLSVGLGPLLVVVASLFNKKAYWKLERIDYIFGVAAAMGIVLWQITGSGLYAIIFSIVADTLAAVPTVLKSYKHPESESATNFGLGVIGAAITLLTVKEWRFEEYGFSLYILLICALFYSLIHFRIGDYIRARNKAL